MKNLFIYLGVAAASVFGLGLTSCSDFLEKQPSNELTEGQVFSDWNMFEQFHYDTYNFLRHGARRLNNSWLDATTDLSVTSPTSGGARNSFNIGNYYSGGGYPELSDTWESRYRGIRKCNMVITRINNVPRNPRNTEEEHAQYVRIFTAEARLFRAYFYWEMFLRYGPVPIVEEVLDPDGDLLKNYTERPTVKEFTSWVINELEECESDLLDYETAWNDTRAGRLGQPVASALLSRIKLYLASPRYAAESGITWNDAVKAAEDFMNKYGANFSLYQIANHSAADNYGDAVLSTTYTGDKNTEVIFYRNDGVINWDGIAYDTPVGEGGTGGNCPSQNLVDMYDMLDGSSPFKSYDLTGAPVYNGLKPEVNTASGYSDAKMWRNRDPRLDATVLYQGVEWGGIRPNSTINVILGQADNPIGNANATMTGYYMRKYIPATILGANHAGTAYRNWVICRYAEILLNLAEALNEVEGPTPRVCDLLDQVRHRAGITGNVADRADLKSQPAMRCFIHKERTVEFAFEEHRSWDVRRWNVAVEALSRPIYGIDVKQDGSIVRKKAQDRVFEERMYLYPIPEAEVWKTNIKNNPGW